MADVADEIIARLRADESNKKYCFSDLWSEYLEENFDGSARQDGQQKRWMRMMEEGINDYGRAPRLEAIRTKRLDH